MSLIEVGRAAVDGLKGAPGFLALVLINALVFMLTYMAIQAEEQRRHEITLRLLDSCAYHQEKN